MNLTAVHDELDRMINSDEFKLGTYPILAEVSDKGNDIQGIGYQDQFGYHRVSIPADNNSEIKQKAKALYDTYRLELSGLTAEERRKSMPVIAIQFRDSHVQGIADRLKLDSTGGYSDQLNYLLYYPVYPTFTETLKLLKEYGVNINDGLSSDDINTIVVTDNTGYEFTEDGEQKKPKADLIISDEAQIRQILEHSYYGLICSNALFVQFTDVDVNAYLKEGHSNNRDGYHLFDSLYDNNSSDYSEEYKAGFGYTAVDVKNLYIYFRADDVPQFLKDYFDVRDESINRCLNRTW